MPRAEPLVLVCGADDHYAMALAVTLRSALVNLSRDRELRLYVIDGGIRDDHRRKLQRTVEDVRPDVSIRWYDPNMAAIDDLWVSGHVTSATYFSLLVPDAVPERYGKAIYLDSDVQVEADLAELWRTPVGDRAVLAVQDYLIPYLSCPGGPANHRELGLAPALPYFNAGVLVFNLARWRSEGISEQIFHYLRRHEKELTFRDQEGLNAVLAGDAGLLDPKWNVPSSLLWFERWADSPFKEQIRPVREDLLRRPGIWHFIGPSKPWQRDFAHPAGARWRRYLEEAGWRGSPESGEVADPLAWLERQRLEDREIAGVVPADSTLILVGNSCRLPQSVTGRRALPFLERNGVYQGNPADDDVAVRELDRMRRSGSRFIVFDSSAFWWFEHYRRFTDHLRSDHSCVRESDRLVIFDLGG